MKNKKFLLPLLAVVFAIAAAFASVRAQQMAWFKPITGPAQEGIITVPADTDANPCTTSGTVQCKVGTRDAYDTEAHANDAPNSTGLLKYN